MGAKPWKAGTDMFGAMHVYDEGGDRITNDRMTHQENWRETCQKIAAAFNAATAVEALGYDGQEAIEKLPEMVEALAQARAYIGIQCGHDLDAIKYHDRVADALPTRLAESE